MSGVILALVEHPDMALHTLMAASRLAMLMGNARINVLAIRMPPEATIMLTEEILTRRQAGESARANIRGAALRACSMLGHDRTGRDVAEWADMEGIAEHSVGEWGRRADFSCSNGRPARRGADRLDMQAALFDTDRPVLVVPPAAATPFGRMRRNRLAGR